MRNRFLLVSLLTMLCTSFAFGQDAFLKGNVVDEKKEPLVDASIRLLQNGVLKAGKKTDFDGNFKIGPVSPGTYTVRISFIGYPDQEIQDVQLKGDKTVDMNTITMSIPDTGGSIRTKEVVIIKFRDPAFDKDETTQMEVMTRKDIKNFASRGVTDMAATAGAMVKTEGGLYSKGGRSNSTVYYVDGIRMNNAPNLPPSAIEQLATINGGIPAEYGDATGGVISITTRGPSKKYFGGLEVLTSQFLDANGYNLLEGNLSGPLIMRNKGTDSASPILGFFLAGNVSNILVSDPPAIDVYRVSDEALERLKNDPISASPIGLGTVPNTEYITKKDMVKSRVRPNTSQFAYSLNGKLDFQPAENINITAGGTYDRSDRNEYIYTFSMFNFENNPQRIDDNYRGFVRFRQNFKTSDDPNAVIKSAYYTLQADYMRTNFTRWDEDLKDDYFKYGYIGKFDANIVPIYKRETRNINGKPVNSQYFTGYQERGVTFTKGGVNPDLENYTQRFFEFAGGEVPNFTTITEFGGLLNGRGPKNAYSLWSGVGANFGAVQKRQQEQYSLNASGAVEVKAHSLKFGIQYEERTDRGYYVGGNQSVQGLWTLARQQMNLHLKQLDLDNPMPRYDEEGNFTDTVDYNFINVGQSTFDKNFRKKLIEQGYRDQDGRLIDNNTYINIDEFAPEDFDLSMFSADELLNNGNSYLNYWGYDHLGNKKTGKSNVDDFLDPNKRSVNAFNPIYIAGYIQDKFEFKDLIFRIGLRVDRFDANQLVLRDPYVLYPTRTAGEVNQINQVSVSHPGNIGNEYAVYVDDAFNPTQIVGYRNGQRWYDAKGAEVADPTVLAQATKNGSIVQPYLVNAENASKQSELQISKESFKDYAPQVNFMPRISFSFPISTTAAFFANYDVLTQRPRNGNISTIDDYYYLEARSTQTINNPDLKPEKRTNYEIGFKQTIGKNSAISMQAFYGEIKDLIQRVQLNQAYPQSYTTFGNIDFGTVKGFTFGYDMKRIQSSGIQLNLNYTLQFAEGTGSDDASAQNLVNSGQPNLRTPFPLDYDVRHQLVGVVDYRFGEGGDYTGPVSGTGENTKQWLKNVGLNLLLNARSGTPYTQQSNLTQGNGVVIGVANRSAITGGVNASRLPWQFRADARVDKDIYFAKKKDDKNAVSPVYLNVYVMVQNIFNAKNIVSVYRYTGLADDDGYLNSVEGQKEANLSINREAFIDQYSIKVNNPDNYTQPRFIRLGASINF